MTRANTQKSCRELVKMTVHEMVKVCQKPLKRHTDTVARRLVTKFLSLVDTNLENDMILDTQALNHWQSS